MADMYSYLVVEKCHAFVGRFTHRCGFFLSACPVSIYVRVLRHTAMGEDITVQYIAYRYQWQILSAIA